MANNKDNATYGLSCIASALFLIISIYPDGTDTVMQGISISIAAGLLITVGVILLPTYR